MSMKYFKNYELDEMDVSELKRVLRELNTEANKRLGVLKEEHLNTLSIALRETIGQRGKRKFTTPRTRSREELENEIFDVQKFLRSPSSKVEGVLAGLKEFKEDFGGSETDYQRYVRNYPEIEKHANSLGIHIDSDIVVKVIEIAKEKHSTKSALQAFDDYFADLIEEKSSSSDLYELEE